MAWESSGGSCWVSASDMAWETEAATGADISFQVSHVASIHSARAHAAGITGASSNAVLSLSHRSASFMASLTAPFCLSVTEGSPFWDATCRACWLARSQFTGSSEDEELIMDWICWNIMDMVCGSTGIPAGMSPGFMAPDPSRRSNISWNGSLGFSPFSSFGGFEGMGPPIVVKKGVLELPSRISGGPWAPPSRRPTVR